MTTFTSPTLTNLLDIVGPVILPFLSKTDIFWELQCASRDIRRSCINTLQVWREFVNKYFLGQILQQKEAKIDPKILHLITQHQCYLTHLDDIPSDVLFSIITGMIPALDIMDTCGPPDEVYWYLQEGVEERVSPFNQVRIRDLGPFDTHANLQLFWSGQWGIFWRVQLKQYPEFDYPFMINLSVWSHKCPLRSGLLAKKEIQQDVMREILESNWIDLMVGVVDARNILHGQCKQQRFERLNVPIKISVKFHSEDSIFQSDDMLDFIYLWPLEDQHNRLLDSDDHLIVTNPNDSETEVKLQIIGSGRATKFSDKVIEEESEEESKEDSEQDSEEEIYEDEE